MKGERREGITPNTRYEITDYAGDTLNVIAYDDGDVILFVNKDGIEVWLRPSQVAKLRLLLETQYALSNTREVPPSPGEDSNPRQDHG